MNRINNTFGWYLSGINVEGSTACPASSIIRASNVIGWFLLDEDEDEPIEFKIHSNNWGEPELDNVQHTISASSIKIIYNENIFNYIK